MMKHVHNSLCMVILAYQADITGHACDQKEREKISQNLEIALGLSFDKFITGYETCFQKKFIAPEQINMSFAFPYIKSLPG